MNDASPTPSVPAGTTSEPAEPAAELREQGRARQKITPRSTLAQVQRGSRSAVDILKEQNSTRLPDLVPLRMARMLTDTFTFYRGTAAIMAADLAASPHSGIMALSSGDAHLSNFGLYASPSRSLVFDINDFDEAGFGPWEWDLKRLVTSSVVGGRQLGYSASRIEKIARRAATRYVQTLSELLEHDALTRYYQQTHPTSISGSLDKRDAAVLEKAIASATKRTSARVFRKITETGADGMLRLREDPPVLTHLRAVDRDQAEGWFRSYLRTLSPDIALLLSQFRLVDVARRVVGVGSVGTRCFLAIMLGPQSEPLVLQLKQAQASVLSSFGEVAQPPVLSAVVSRVGEGARVVASQRILQATSDPFLGSMQADGLDLYVRQFHDMKGSFDLTSMKPKTFENYAAACAAQLARAHSQTRHAFDISGYCGGGGQVASAVTEFAHRYADVVARDFHDAKAAATRGEIPQAPDPLN